MAVLNIIKYGNPILKRKTNPIKEVTPEIKKLIKDMIETMISAKGIGLAANQVGIPIRLIVINAPPLRVLINPEIIKKKGKAVEQEGCLSFPGVYIKIKRSKWVRVKALDYKGKSVIIEGEGVLSRVLQHEIDHLNCKLFIDRLPFWKKLKVNKIIKKVILNKHKEIIIN